MLLSLPCPSDIPDVFYPRFIADQEKWDADTWVRKPRPLDNATSNGVNNALLMLSYVACTTLDRTTESACLLSYRGGFTCLVFDHDEAYRRIMLCCPGHRGHSV